MYQRMIQEKHRNVIKQYKFSFSEPCAAGQFLDQSNGCVNCPEDEWSVAENTNPSCTACPQGKGVAAGQGKIEDDCTWSEQIFHLSFCIITLNILLNLTSVILILRRLVAISNS